jgi:hypothetical protein
MDIIFNLFEILNLLVKKLIIFQRFIIKQKNTHYFKYLYLIKIID